MFISTGPRYVLNEFGSFVPVQRMDRFRQKILEMPNNDANAWKAHKPVAYIEDFDEFQNDVFENNENFNTEDAYSRDMKISGVSPISCTEVADFKSNYAGAARGLQYSSSQKYDVSYQTFQTPSKSVDYYARPRQTRENFTSDLDLGLGFDGLPVGQSFGDQYTLGSSMQAASAPGSLLEASFSDNADWPMSGSFGSDRTSSSPPTYGNYSSVNSSPNQPLLGLENLNLYGNDGLPTSMAWPAVAASAGSGVLSEDGLPRYQSYVIPSSGHGSMGSAAHLQKWSSELAGQNTIAPKDLRVNVPPAPPSSSGSSQANSSGWFDYHNNCTSELSSPESLVVEEKPKQRQHHDQHQHQHQHQHHHRSQRRLLPSTVSSSHRQKLAPPIEDQDYIPDREVRRSLRKSIQQEQPKSNATHVRIAAAVEKTSSSRCEEKSSRASSASDTTQSDLSMEANEVKECSSSKCSWTAIDSTFSGEAHQRNPKDDFLVESKMAGMSYKDIKKKGNFTEAESTLRGRFRTLTKPKSARVRKPEWNHNDIRLLKKAVRKLTPNADRRRVQWKQVAEYIVSHGGSYRFGNATCRKRWDELQGNSSG